MNKPARAVLEPKARETASASYDFFMAEFSVHKNATVRDIILKTPEDDNEYEASIDLATRIPVLSNSRDVNSHNENILENELRTREY